MGGFHQAEVQIITQEDDFMRVKLSELSNITYVSKNKPVATSKNSVLKYDGFTGTSALPFVKEIEAAQQE